MEVTGRQTGSRRPGVLAVAALAAAALAAAPLAGIVAAAMSDTGSGVPLSGALGYAWTSLGLALCVGALIIPAGAFTAWLVTAYEFPGRAAFAWALALPLAMPVFACAYAYADLFDVAGPVRSWIRSFSGRDPGLEMRSFQGAVIVFALAFYPYVFLAAKAALASLGASQIEAARSLGGRPTDRLVRVALPIIWPSVAAGAALGIMETLADFGAVHFLSVQTLTTAVVRSWSVYGSVSAAASYALPLLALAALLLWGERALRGARRFSGGGGWRPLPRTRLRGGRALAASMACGALLVAALLLPAGWLAIKALQVTPDIERLVRAASVSVGLSASGAAITVGLALLLALGARGRPFSVRLASLGYAAPGAVIALGLLAPVSFVWRLGQGEVAILTSLVLLLYAYSARLTAAALEPLDAALLRIRPSIVPASRSLGCSEVGAALSVEIPMIGSAIAAAALVVFVDIMKELPATLMIRPFNFDTLAVIASNYANDERLSQAGWPSLVIVCLSLPAVAWLARRAEQGYAADGGSAGETQRD